MGLTWDDDDLYGKSNWNPEPLSRWLVGILAFMVGFALCYLIFVP